MGFDSLVLQRLMHLKFLAKVGCVWDPTNHKMNLEVNHFQHFFKTCLHHGKHRILTFRFYLGNLRDSQYEMIQSGKKPHSQNLIINAIQRVCTTRHAITRAQFSKSLGFLLHRARWRKTIKKARTFDLLHGRI